jgi:hypothetical protein
MPGIRKHSERLAQRELCPLLLGRPSERCSTFTFTYEEGAIIVVERPEEHVPPRRTSGDSKSRAEDGGKGESWKGEHVRNVFQS